MDYKEINITEWNQVGEGGIGKTYELRSNPDILLKVNKGDMNNEATVNRSLNSRSMCCSWVSPHLACSIWYA